MDWKSIYESRLCSADEAVRAIKSNQRIFMTGNVSVPLKLLAALVRYAPNLKNVELCQALSIAPADYVKPEMEGHLRINTLFISANVRKAVQEARADFTPVLLSEFTLLFKNGILPVDVAMVHVSPPDEHGFCSLGVEVGLTKTPAESAKIILAEANEQMPRTLGDSFIHVSRLTHIVPVNYPVAELPQGGEGDEDSRKIAGFIAELIPDGATLQMGIGGIPDAVLGYLGEKKDLGIHSEMFSDGVVSLVEKGVINNSRKTLHAGKIVVGFILGTQQLYRWAHDNPLCEFHRQEYVNDPFVIAQNDRHRGGLDRSGVRG
jgi:4-hydroxybutyrate CoA-transferase